MAVVTAILPLVSQSSGLALLLYRLAAADEHAAKDLLRTAKAISNLALIVKEVGTIIKEDDRLPSAEAFETIEDVLEQSAAIFSAIDSMVSTRDQEHDNRQNGQQKGSFASTLTPHSVARLHYLKAHLDALRATLSVMLQTLYTAQSIMWAEVRPYVSPRQCATAVANEKQQLETLIIDQQMTILLALKLFEQVRPDARLLMENDSSLSLSRVDDNKTKPADLVKYQDKFIASLDTQTSDEEHWLASVCGIAKSQLDRLLERWTSLRQFEANLLEEKRKKQAKQRESQQPFVESDSEDDVDTIPKVAGTGIDFDLPVSQRPDTVQPLFTEPTSLPIPVSTPTPTPTPTSSHSHASLPPSPRTSISTLPVEAAAAVEAKEEDAELDLEIPWTLRTRRHFWKYIDGKVQESNTDMPTSEAFRHRHSWTEVQASWVSPDALKEAGHPFTRVRKEIPDGRRTKSETWFCIDRPLTFDEVQRLVERTVELYRKAQPPSPPPEKARTRRTSFDRRPTGYDRDRTPLPPLSKQPPPPPLERSTTAYHISQPPPLDRTMSMPGPNQAQSQAQAQVPPPITYPPKPRPNNLQIPTPSTPLPQSAPYSPKLPPQSTPKPAPPYPSQTFPPPPGQPRAIPIPQPSAYQPPPPPPHPPSTRHLQPHAQVYSASPLRTSMEGGSSRYDYYSSASGTSDSESVMRSRKGREKSRRRGSSSGRRKKGHGKTGALMGVAGLTALLDGLVGI